MPDFQFTDVPVGDPITVTIERPSKVEHDNETFSHEAIRTAIGTITEFILVQVSKQWEATDKAPSKLTVTVSCLID